MSAFEIASVVPPQAPRQALFNEVHDLMSRTEGLVNHVESITASLIGHVPTTAVDPSVKLTEPSSPADALYTRISHLHRHIDSARASLDRLQSTLL